MQFSRPKCNLAYPSMSVKIYPFYSVVFEGLSYPERAVFLSAYQTKACGCTMSLYYNFCLF